MAGLKELYKKRKEFLNKEALTSARLAGLQEEMALHAPYQHQMTYDLMPANIKEEFESMGRNGDTEIRNIDGKPAHVTHPEAGLLDSLGKAAIPSIKRRGAGTTNPQTGLKEYHGSFANPWNTPMGHPLHHAGIFGGEGVFDAVVEDQIDDIDWDSMQDSYDEMANPENIDYSDMSSGNFDQFMDPDFNMESYLDVTYDVEDPEYFEDIFDPESFELLEEGYGLQQKRIGKQTRDIGFKTGQEMRNIMSQADKMKSQSGLATSGTITSMMDKQKDELLSGYKSQKEGLGLDKQEAAFGYKSDKFKERTRMMDEFYDRLQMYQQNQ